VNYKTELHCHCNTVSACAQEEPEALVEQYIEGGYSTIVLTDHLSRFTYLQSTLGDISDIDWQKKIDYFLSGYERVCRAAKGKLNVILGVELRLNTTESDYLIYGVDEAFLRAHPDMMDMRLREISALVREAGGLFIQAHPFRNYITVSDPALLDGVEVCNLNARHDSRNDIAALWAEKFSLIPTSGGDYHRRGDIENGGGIMTDVEITSGEQLVGVLRSGNYKIICPAGER
jgi:predicted metal-dependent phosphoesterase TrpH